MGLSHVIQDVDWLEFAIKGLMIVIIIAGTMIASKLMNAFIQKRIDKATTDVTHLNYFKHILTGVIYFIGILLVLFQSDYLKSISISILASSGVVAVIIGFASQQSFANIVSGLFMSFFKPFRIGDRIRFIDKNTAGIVEDITLRHTVIRTFENKRIIVPNNIMNNEMIENANIVDDKTCNFLDISISLDSDADHAMRIIRECVIAHKDCLDNRTAEDIEKGVEPIAVRLIGFGEFSMNLRAWIWSKDPGAGFEMLCDLRKTIKERFDNEGIAIPGKHRTIVVKNHSGHL